MKKKLNLPVCLFILALILCIGSVHYSAASVQAATVTKKQIGFVKKNGNWYYYDKNGKKATGWYQSASGNKYYFGKTGAATGNHLHFKITKGGTAVNPIYYVNYRNDFSSLKKING